MPEVFKSFNHKVAGIFNSGGVGIIPTDTIYGICGQALNKSVVCKIYKLRRRSPKKPMIVLIASAGDLKLFGIKISAKMKNILNKAWPGKVSVVLPCRNKEYTYLHRGTQTLAFRLPKNKKLIKLLKNTGPLVAPSANWEGFSVSININQAKKYFGTVVDFYVDAGIKKSSPSALIEIKTDGINILREGGRWLRGA